MGVEERGSALRGDGVRGSDVGGVLIMKMSEINSNIWRALYIYCSQNLREELIVHCRLPFKGQEIVRGYDTFFLVS